MLPDCLSAEGERRCRQLLATATARLRARPAAAAVLVPLCSVRGAPALLYTLRSSRLAGRHKGDVSFPGGKCDPGDRDVVHTALRETQEELGLAVPEDRVWGVLQPVYDQPPSPAQRPATAMPPLTACLPGPGTEHRGAGAGRRGPAGSPEPPGQPRGGGGGVRAAPGPPAAGAAPGLHALLQGRPLPLHDARLPPRPAPRLGAHGRHHRVRPAGPGARRLPAPPGDPPGMAAPGLKAGPAAPASTPPAPPRLGTE